MKAIYGYMFLNGQKVPVRQPISYDEFCQQFMFMKMNAAELQVGSVEGYMVTEIDVQS